MNQILVSQPGKVAVLPEPAALPTVIRVQGFRPARAVITALTYSQNVAAQFLTTLQNVIYVYTIGDDIGTVQVSGVAFSSLCTDNSNTHGISDIFTAYDDLKILSNQRTVAVTIGDKALVGLLIGLQVSTGEVEFGLINYVLTFRILPDETHLRAAQKQEPDYGQSTQDTTPTPDAPIKDGTAAVDTVVKKDNRTASVNNESNSFVSTWANAAADAVNYVKTTAGNIVNSLFSLSKTSQASGDTIKADSPASRRNLIEKGAISGGTYA